MASIFTRIIQREIPAYLIDETPEFIAFLDVHPNAVGHTLCVPKREVDKITELTESEFGALMQFSRRVALAIEKAIPCKRVGWTVIGLEVPHVHVHLIPLNTMADATFGKKESLSQEAFAAVAERIKSALSQQ
ncbi:MAG: HIT family protein [Flavobacteriaceae bacterium]|jgi:histidine triad (HIT) family protein